MEPNQKGRIFSVVKEDGNGKLHTGNIPNLNDNNPIFTIGCYGAQKVGKSTLLNLLYGANFKVEQTLEANTTEGINGCFVKNNESFNNEDTIVLDCEGEKSQKKKIAIRKQVFDLPKLTPQEKEDKAESILKVSDTRYATFLWCASNCIMVLLPNTAPNNDTTRFFELIHQSMERIQRTNHQLSLILIFRTNKDRLNDLIPAYTKVFNGLKGFSTLISDFKMLHLPEFDETPDEPAFQNALTVIKEEINKQSIKHEKFIQVAWAECLKITAFKLNKDANLEDLSFLKAQIELNFILSQNKNKIKEIAEYLENLINLREKVNIDFDQTLFRDYKQQANLLIEAVTKNTNDYKAKKTVKSVGVGLATGLAIAFPPFAIGGILLGVSGIAVDSDYNNTIELLSNTFQNESQKVTEKLSNVHGIMNEHQENSNKARLSLCIHETSFSRIEFFYAIARAVLKNKKPEATPDECVRYMFILFSRNLDVGHNEIRHTSISEKQSLYFDKVSNAFSGSLVIGSNLGILLRGGYKFVAKASGEVFSSLGKTVLRTVKYGGVAVAGVFEVFDLVSTWRTDQSKLIDNMKESQEKIGGFYEMLREFWNANAEMMKKVDEITKVLEEFDVLES